MMQWVFETSQYGNERAAERRQHDYLRLDNNENTGPLPDSVRQALESAISETLGDQSRCALYPYDSVATHAVAAYTRSGFQGVGGWPQCTADNVLLTNGCDQAIDVVVRAYCDPSTTVLLLRPTFPMYAHYLRATAATVEYVDYGGEGPNFEFPAERILTRVAELGAAGTRVVVLLAHPDNPSGASVPGGFVTDLREANSDALLVVDEAYFEFCPERSIVPQLSDDNDNLIVLRSMSKCFGMAGLRLGFIIAARGVISGHAPVSKSPVQTAYLSKTRGPYDVNELALVAACAHLDDLTPTHDYVADVMTDGRPTTISWLKGAAIVFAPGAANFCLVRGSEELPNLSVDSLAENGVLVRAQSFHPEARRVGTWFRMSYPRSPELERLATALTSCGVPV